MELRLFITINLEQQIKDQVRMVLPSLKCRFKGRFVPSEHWHITTLFLGEVEEDQIPLIEQSMKEAVKVIRPFQLWIEGIGAFPSLKKPNILWAGVGGDLKPLNQLYHQLIKTIEPLKIDFDAKPVYTPHLTLARKVIPQTCQETGELNLKTKPWTVNALELYQSIFIHQGVKYHRILKTNF
ncbi:RNA 2',3'-cyclic phosphodiesterase [Tepidibacillus fermentans]|uniref:RNA 2',3'-cyclic phosphodiesterase n=1 Tax=Tepidibacillus fermentans TaxID=1281767 RepID=A0A4R3KL99_9BACI|nr:RNA 2',3'-cyclic phosphodiesterase [Tepidibacillus fermentans]TCS84517.1 2'-5' RNA ligase [Tepidibacillus fermentans]